MGHKKARCSYRITVCNERNRIIFQNTNIKVRQKYWFFWSLDQQVVVKLEEKNIMHDERK